MPGSRPTGRAATPGARRPLRIVVVDLVSKGPTRALYARIMNPNVTTVMPQAVAAWCARDGHDVRLVVYTGFEDLLAELSPPADLVLVSAFTHAAQTAYALSAFCRTRGAVTALGGPHARAYPEDACRFFDYVFGLTDREVLRDVLQECARHRPRGVAISAARQPDALPGARERWPFLAPVVARAPLVQIAPTIGSLGCPYSCSFCVDAEIPHQPFDLEAIRDDLRFLHALRPRPWVSWYDPNFGVRFDETLGAIEEAVPPGSLRFVAESSLSLLSERNARRLRRAGFRAILPGIESWFDLGRKSKTGSRTGLEKVREVADQVRAIQRHIPFVQTNFVLGLDADAGPEPFELTKRFLDEAPAAFPAISLLSAFGRSAPANLRYQREGRVLGFPFHVLSNVTMNVLPKHYGWREFYDHVIGLLEHAFGLRGVARRLAATKTPTMRLLSVLRAISTEGSGRIRYYRDVRRRLDEDPAMAAYYAQETAALPPYYREQVRRGLGPLWPWLPEGALLHDPSAWAREQAARPQPRSVRTTPAQRILRA